MYNRHIKTIYVKVLHCERIKTCMNTVSHPTGVFSGSSRIDSIQLVNAHKSPYTSCSPETESHDATSKRIFNKTGPPPPSTPTQPGSPDPSNRITLISHSPSVSISRVLMESFPYKKNI